MPSKAVPTLVAVLLVTTSALLAGAAITVEADSEYEMTMDGSIETPTREVDIEGATYEVSAITKADEGDSLDVSVQAPQEDQIYRVYLYNSDRQIVKGNSAEGSQTVTFNLSDLEAGTYVFAVQEEGVNQVIRPLVIKGYSTSVEAPTTATVGDDITIDITADQLTNNATVDRVEVVVAGETSLINQTATDTESGYTATVDTSTLQSGTYSIYATVRGDKTVFNRKIIYGVSDSQSLSLAADDDRENEEANSGGGGGGGSGSEGTTESSDTTEDDTSTVSDDEGGGDSGSAEQDGSDSAGDSEGTESTDSGEAESTSDGASANSADPDTNTEDSMPGFGVTSIAILSLSVGLFIRLRSN